MNSTLFRLCALSTLALAYLLVTSTAVVLAAPGDMKGRNKRHGMVDFPDTIKEELKDKHTAQPNSTKAQRRLGKIFNSDEVKKSIERHQQEREAEFDRKMKNEPTVYKTLDERRKQVEESSHSP